MKIILILIIKVMYKNMWKTKIWQVNRHHRQDLTKKLFKQIGFIVITTSLLITTNLGKQTNFVLAQDASKLEQLELREQIREKVREEIDFTFRHTTALLNTFLIILALLPIAATVGIWILQAKLAKKVTTTEQEIDSVKYDVLSQLKGILNEAQNVLDDLKRETEIADEKIGQLHHEVTLLQYSPAEPENDKPLLMATDYAKQGDNLFFAGQYQEAIDTYDQALKIHPNLADTWNNRGVVLTRLAQYDEAIASYDRAISIRPEYPDAWNNRGVSLLEMQQYQEAIVSYEQAIKVKPDYADAWNNRGVALAKMQQYQEAVKSYNQALAIKNNYSDAWNNRGVALTRLGIYGEAIACYDNATKIRPEFFSAWYNRARCYALQKNVELAIESLTKAKELNSVQCLQMVQKEPDFQEIINHDLFQAFLGERAIAS